VDAPTLKAYNMGNSLEERVALLRKLCWDPKNGIRSPVLLPIARRITQGCVARDAICELRAIYRFVVENVRYTGDIAGVDTFSSPLRTLQMGGEDCDGHAVLCAALAICNGFKAKVRITSNRGVTWDHIYCMVGMPKGRADKWVVLDTTLARNQQDFSRFNVEPPRAKFQDFTMEMP
jgi:transglutaminase-like putative cysteine protease